MRLKLVTGLEAAQRLAKSIAQDILKSGADPLDHTRRLEMLWIRTGYPTELAEYGILGDEVSVARQMGRSDADIRSRVVTKLKELASADLIGPDKRRSR